MPRIPKIKDLHSELKFVSDRKGAKYAKILNNKKTLFSTHQKHSCNFLFVFHSKLDVGRSMLDVHFFILTPVFFLYSSSAILISTLPIDRSSELKIVNVIL